MDWEVIKRDIYSWVCATLPRRPCQLTHRKKKTGVHSYFIYLYHVRHIISWLASWKYSSSTMAEAQCPAYFK